MYRRNRVGIFDRITKYELRNYIDNLEDKRVELRWFKEDKKNNELEIAFALLSEDVFNTLIIFIKNDNPKARIEFVSWPSAAPIDLDLTQLDLITDFVQFCEARDMLVLLRALYSEKEIPKRDVSVQF